jgi:hypothetical protein
MKVLVLRTVVLALVAALLSAAAAAGAVREPGAQGPLGNERLSDETSVTRWAHAARRAPVRTAPRRGARSLTRLRYWTEDHRPEVYLVLASRRVRGTTWLHIRVPGRPNGRTGWVAADALGALHLVRTRFVVDHRTLRATLYRAGRVIWQAPVGVGAPGTPTPRGRFYIREKLRAAGGVYGPWAFGTSAYSSLSDWPGGGVVGVHGTNQPGALPARISHGCIRVRNADIERLARLMPIGTPVQIL